MRKPKPIELDLKFGDASGRASLVTAEIIIAKNAIDVSTREIHYSVFHSGTYLNPKDDLNPVTDTALKVFFSCIEEVLREVEIPRFWKSINLSVLKGLIVASFVCQLQTEIFKASQGCVVSLEDMRC
ncbi:hypothetical protein PN466_00805 [Roseofilum reptotaenium CS-1145]|uniref:Uncharacterized protein n=1 Tax=Roseofilum reptotaenium AO1-A TaxID=1925591 RepID=A0A1L9QKK1_9CYAN|nr:hypothetical protein [Roseofilum reptotaenium]MDB9515501.1 hypothetical protein [Roseofilum reptotaenium CS-1145]OJJ16938.1 hypothetical protein BI308_23265 [Roseofilum reptotaenium AO1-A]